MNRGSTLLTVVASVALGAALHAYYQIHVRLAQEQRDVARKKRINEEDKTDEDRLRTALSILSNAQKIDLALSPLPNPLASLVPSRGWSRCEAAIAAVEADYSNWKKNRSHKNVLISAFNPDDPGGWKAKVDALIASSAQKVFPDLVEQLRTDDSLVLLLLEAPNIGTTEVLVHAMPGLRGVGHKVCIPQADPQHYSCMVGELAKRHVVEGRDLPGATNKKRGTKGNKKKGNTGGSSGIMVEAAIKVAAERAKAEAVIKAQAEAQAKELVVNHMLLNVRQQRLDQWLSVNAHMGLRVAIFFADYESSWAGRPKVKLSPLRDVQRFFR